MLRFATLRSDVVWSSTFNQLSCYATLGLKDMMENMLRHRKWYTDDTFNMWKGLVNGITFRNTDFVDAPIQVGVIYLHQVILFISD